MFLFDIIRTRAYNLSEGVIMMNSWLIAAILSAILVLFNLYLFISRGTASSLILLIVWLLVAIKNLKRYRAEKDENS